MSSHTVILGNPYKRGDNLHFLNSSDSEPSVIMQEGAPRVLQGDCQGHRPKARKGTRGDNIKKVSERKDKACHTGEKVPAASGDVLTCPWAHTVRVKEMPMAMCFDDTNIVKCEAGIILTLCSACEDSITFVKNEALVSPQEGQGSLPRMLSIPGLPSLQVPHILTVTQPPRSADSP